MMMMFVVVEHTKGSPPASSAVSDARGRNGVATPTQGQAERLDWPWRGIYAAKI